MAKQLPYYIKDKLNKGEYIVDKHFSIRRRERNLTNIDIVQALNKGQVIESMYRYGYGEYFLVHCKVKKIVFHIALYVDYLPNKKSRVLLKTIYYPTEDKFEKDKKTRKNGYLHN